MTGMSLGDYCRGEEVDIIPNKFVCLYNMSEDGNCSWEVKIKESRSYCRIGKWGKIAFEEF